MAVTRRSAPISSHRSLQSGGSSDQSRDVVASEQTTWNPNIYGIKTLVGHFEKPSTLPAPINDALAAAMLANPSQNETGVIKDSFQGQFNVYTVVSYSKVDADHRKAVGTGISLDGQGKPFGKFDIR